MGGVMNLARVLEPESASFERITGNPLREVQRLRLDSKNRLSKTGPATSRDV